MATAAAVENDNQKFTIDIRIFLIVIVSSMTLSFGFGVGLFGGGVIGVGEMITPLTQLGEMQQHFSVELPKVTSVIVQEAMAAAGEGSQLHEPAGQVRGEKQFVYIDLHSICIYIYYMYYIIHIARSEGSTHVSKLTDF
jgi:hypothetical protein